MQLKYSNKYLFITFFLCFIFVSCKEENEKNKIDHLLNEWHKAAAESNFDIYFSMMSDSAVFIGTDATERWNKTQFMAYAKPHFEKNKGWKMTSLKREIIINNSKEIAWFDELLNTKMKICRGSGVLVKTNGKWEIQHYVLSMTIPNELADSVITIKSTLEDPIIKILSQ
jgi:hypothetical protein